jgi:hypothetical protein
VHFAALRDLCLGVVLVRMFSYYSVHVGIPLAVGRAGAGIVRCGTVAVTTHIAYGPGSAARWSEESASLISLFNAVTSFLAALRAL